MKPIFWNEEKNLWLKATRGLSFDDVVTAFNNDNVLDEINHPNQKKYPGQKMFIVVIQGYCCAVPFIENEHDIFLKTIYPSRKASKKYLRKEITI